MKIIFFFQLKQIVFFSRVLMTLLSLLHNFIQLSMNSGSVQAQSLFVVCPRFVMIRISDKSLTYFPAGNKVKRFSLVNHTTPTFNHHRHIIITTSWVGFLLSGLKLISDLQAQSLILHKSLFKWKFQRAVLVTIKDKKVSSGKCFGLECKFSVKLLMYSREKSVHTVVLWAAV